jgi:hypothetical protein
MKTTRNDFRITRDLGGHRVEIKAEKIERLDIYGVTVVVNGVTWDTLQSDDILGDAVNILSEAFGEIAEPEATDETV